LIIIQSSYDQKYKQKNEMTLNPRAEMERSIAIGIIGKGTIQKQFLDVLFDIHPDFCANDAINDYNRLKADMIARYTAGAGSTEIAKELYRRYDIRVTTHTLVAWLREHGVQIRPPTRQRKRLPRTTWEKKLWGQIVKLKSEIKAMKNQKQIELSAKNELIALLRSQIEDLSNENFNLRQEVGRLTRVVETLKSTKTDDKNEKKSK